MEGDRFAGGLESSQRQVSIELPEKAESEVGQVAMLCDAAAGTGCFDCNICLDFSRDPVVTFCGHLYCWPCIYKWLTTQQWCPVCKATLSQAALVPLYGRGLAAQAAESGIGIPDRPSATCIAHPLEATSPLALAEPPPQPTSPHATSNQGSQQYYHYNHHHHHHHHQYYSYNQHLLANFAGGSATGHAIHRRAGGMVYALLPWVLGLMFGCPQSLLYLSQPYYLNGTDSGGSIAGRWQRERQAEMSLSRVSVFFLCCLVLCLFLF